MEVRATVIVDNKSREGLPGEWGLCIYIEKDGKKDSSRCRGIGFVCDECRKIKNCTGSGGHGGTFPCAL